MLTLAKHSISLYVESSGRCSTAWGQNEIFCQSKVLFPLVHACYKNLQHRSKHNPIIWAWRNRAKLNFLSDIHWLSDIEPLIALFSFPLCMCNMFCFLWPSWMTFLRYAYISLSYRWDLAATSLAYIWYLDATSVKKTHSHSSPLSEQGTVRVGFLHSSLHIHCFDICIDWQEEKQMTRLNSLHPSLGAWKDSTLCILPLGPEKTKKTNKTKKKPKTCPQCLQSLEIFVFFCFFVFVFLVFLVVFVFCLFRPLWPILAYLGILWPIVALWWCENTARGKHCKTLQGKQCKTHGRTASFSVNQCAAAISRSMQGCSGYMDFMYQSSEIDLCEIHITQTSWKLTLQSSKEV